MKSAPPPIAGLEHLEPAAQRPAALGGLSLEAARALAIAHPGFARAPQLVLARQLAMLVEAAIELADPTARRPTEEVFEPVASAWLTLGVRPADLVLVLLEAEQIVDALALAECGADAPDPAHWQRLRKGLRDMVRYLCEHLAPLDTERERRRLTDLLEALPEAILLVDENECVYHANGQVREAYGVEPASTVGRSLADVLTEPALLLRLEDPEEFLLGSLQLLGAHDQPYEDVFRQIDGSTFVRRSLPAGDGGRFVLTTNVTRVRLRNQDIEKSHMSRTQPPLLRIAAERRTTSSLRLLQGGSSD